ncbi:hypothetical protein SECTIM467_122 [Brevibacillus phage SecTim467]|uniref:Uncharacterized protein n=2 Tax=Jenstvirus jenst TaxID=1982225 RepID=A0A0K2CPM1_9CAUD|nr:hypothetical protein AVV11_gp074 [Brevibacillus phage Jenst]ALA07246.1 hypothetical protein JENST_117 [Brevibacillus phage Jenst]ALA07570.1 hypothetical protein SECTIM467_122 [Brevibacillus phage SecTim467]
MSMGAKLARQIVLIRDNGFRAKQQDYSYQQAVTRKEALYQKVRELEKSRKPHKAKSRLSVLINKLLGRYR